MYNRHGYVDIVSRLAERSMQGAVEEVQALPEYSTKGEVIEIVCSKYEEYKHCFSTYSGSSLTPDMTRLPMPTTRLFRAFLEGDNTCDH